MFYCKSDVYWMLINFPFLEISSCVWFVWMSITSKPTWTACCWFTAIETCRASSVSSAQSLSSTTSTLPRWRWDASRIVLEARRWRCWIWTMSRQLKRFRRSRGTRKWPELISSDFLRLELHCRGWQRRKTLDSWGWIFMSACLYCRMTWLSFVDLHELGMNVHPVLNTR